jgi:Holliday junction resolvase RusA-like endonuclease
MIKTHLCLTIQGQCYSKKNNKRILKNFKTDKMFIASSEQYLKSKDSFLWQLADASNKREWQAMLKANNGLKPLKLEFTFYQKTKQRFDYCNIVQGIQDLLVEAGYLEDDNANEVLPVFAPYQVDKNNPRVEIRLVKLQATDYF